MNSTSLPRDFKEWLDRPPRQPKKRTRLRLMSKKRMAENKVYSKLKAEFLAEFPLCEAGEKWGQHFSGCTNKARDIHHQRRRGRFYCDKRYFIPICRACHDFLETHANIARELGLLK